MFGIASGWGPGLLTHRTYSTGRCRCGEHPGEAGAGCACKTVGSVIANPARADAGRAARDVTHSSRTKGSGAAAMDRFVDQAIGATSAVRAIGGTAP
jgi:hypothetical protein